MNREHRAEITPAQKLIFEQGGYEGIFNLYVSRKVTQWDLSQAADSLPKDSPLLREMRTALLMATAFDKGRAVGEMEERERRHR